MTLVDIVSRLNAVAKTDPPYSKHIRLVFAYKVSPLTFLPYALSRRRTARDTTSFILGPQGKPFKFITKIELI